MAQLKTPTHRSSTKTWTFGQATPVHPAGRITTLGWPEGSFSKADPPWNRSPIDLGLLT